MGYQDEILQIRQQRAQRDIAEAQEAIREKYQRRGSRAQPSGQHGDAETFETWDRECEQLGGRMATVSPPPPPQAPRAFRANQEICQRAASLLSALRRRRQIRLTRRPTNLPLIAGLKLDTVEYFKYCDDALDMYGQRL